MHAFVCIPVDLSTWVGKRCVWVGYGFFLREAAAASHGFNSFGTFIIEGEAKPDSA